MKKVRTKSVRKEVAVGGQTGSCRQLSLPQVLLRTKAALWELVMDAGMQVLGALLEDDRTELCGPPSRPNPARQAYRHGSCAGEVVLGGRKVTVSRPRVRSLDGHELPLASWAAMSDTDPLDKRVVEQMLIGVSTRKYRRSLEPLDESLQEHGTSKSSVSRRFVARTAAQVQEFLSRPLDSVDLPVVMIDGKRFGDHLLLVALGIDAQGAKHVLGVVEGTTESERACTTLLRSLTDRGLQVERQRLFVIDGGKGLRKAIRTVFGAWAAVQRCQVHKVANVIDHLPEAKRAWVRAAMRKAYDEPTSAKARQRLIGLAKQLEQQHPTAGGSLREGLDETLTIIDLGVTGPLARTLRSTNPIENLNSILETTARRVKRWRGGSMALRWAVGGLMEAEERFHRIKGFAQLPELLTSLEALTSSLDSCTKIA